MNTRATRTERLHRVLAILGEKCALPDAPEDALAEFADAIADSDYAILCDWRLTNVAVLMQMAAHLRPAAIDIDEDGNDCVLTVEHTDGSTVSTRFENVDAVPRDEMVARFITLLPDPRAVWKVRAYEETDTDLYLVLQQATAEQIRQALEAEFSVVFRELTTT